MKPIPVTPETLDVARRVIWFERPEQTLEDPIRFLAYAMTYALHEDMQVIRRHVSDDDFREALDRAPAGIVDPRSWAYWNSKMGRYPPPPLPVRRFGAGESDEPTPTSSASIRAPKPSIEERQRQGREAWLKKREQNPPASLEEIQRRARENWLSKYGPDRK